MSGLYSILQRIAEEGTTKEAFVPMPGGDPAAGGMPPMDPAAAGGGGMMPPGVDPAMMAAVSGQASIPELMAQQGAPVDPAMAMAAGAPLPQEPAAAPAPEAPPTEGGTEGKSKSSKDRVDDRLANIEAMLNKVMGVMMGKGLLEAEEVPGTETEASAINPEVAPEVATMGEPAAKAASASQEPAPQISESNAKALADLLGRLAQK